MTQENLAENISATSFEQGGDVVSIGFIIQILKFVREQYVSSAAHVEEQAIRICDEFKELARQTEEQGQSIEDVVDLARNIELEGETIPYAKSVEVLYEPLAEAISNILQVSKLAMSMVMTIGNAADNITRVENCIEQVQKLTRQTNMLAMNTQIEAARAGEAGRSFRIIAQEVKGLSESIKTVSEQIRDEAGEVSVSVKESSKMVDQLANYDMTDNLQLRSRIDSLIESIMRQNQRFTELLEQSARAAQTTANAIGALVVSIQFQDRNSQLTGNLGVMLDYVIDELHKIEAKQAMEARQKVLENDIEALVANVTLSELRNNALHYFHDKGDLSEDSALYQRYLAPKEQAQSSSGGDALFGDDEDDDDIELF